MSISEIFDNGIHPWANLRFNNLTIDGTITNNNPTLSGTLSIPFSGPFPTTNFNVDYYKIGKLVTLNFSQIISSAAGGTTGTTITSAANSIPAYLLPDFVGQTEMDYIVRVTDNGVQVSPGFFQIHPDGSIIIYKNLQGATFGINNQRGCYSTTLSYISAN